MTSEEAQRQIIEYWLRKADDALQSAHSEAQAQRFDFVVNRAYYACFYAASAVLLAMGRRFVKHSGLRAAVHKDLVKTGQLDPQWGKAFDRIFENRQFADYIELHRFEREQLEEIVKNAEGFVQEMRRLVVIR